MVNYCIASRLSHAARSMGLLCALKSQDAESCRAHLTLGGLTDSLKELLSTAVSAHLCRASMPQALTMLIHRIPIKAPTTMVIPRTQIISNMRYEYVKKLVEEKAAADALMQVKMSMVPTKSNHQDPVGREAFTIGVELCSLNNQNVYWIRPQRTKKSKNPRLRIRPFFFEFFPTR